jgi:hypothetical protein
MMFELILVIFTIIGGLAAIDYFCNGCVKKFNLLTSFPKSKIKSKQVSMREPSGTMPLDSPFYVERSPIEADCYNNIT